MIVQGKQSFDGRITQKQIAIQLGVSRQLVSFAIAGKGRMSDEKRQKILQMARENDYHEFSNHEARQMLSRRYGKRLATGMLAVVFEAKFEGQPLSSLPYFSPYFEGLESEAIERGLDLVLCALRPEGLPLLVREQRVDGVVCLSTSDEDTARIRALEPRVVSLPYDVPNAACLGMDNQGGLRLATSHLIELGHRRIAYLGIGKSVVRSVGKSITKVARARLAGYRRALRDAGLTENTRWIDDGVMRPTSQAGADAMAKMLKKVSPQRAGSTPDANNPGANTPGLLPFTAVACYNDAIAMGAIEALREAGWSTPGDISVCGFDDISVQSGFAPTLTSIAFPRREMGRRAVQLICEHNAAILAAQNEAPGETRGDARASLDFDKYHQQFPVSLIARDSTAPPVV